MAGVRSRPRLRFMTSGSVDDGKSTLIGRLLHDSGAIFEDHLAEALKAGGCEELDFSFLVDGLKAEREQGITIDVAYRYFTTGARAFLIADAPGHEQYTRNQAAAASQVELAVVVVSAPDGVRRQTRRHMAIAAMFGVRSIVLVVNKMDLAGWDERIFQSVAGEAAALAGRFGLSVVAAIPVCARSGAHVTERFAGAPWYRGPALLEVLEGYEAPSRDDAPFVLPIQAIARLEGGGRLVLGEATAGRIRPGGRLKTSDGHDARIEKLWVAGAPVECAAAGDPVAVQLSPERDLSRGMTLADEAAEVKRALQLQVRLIALDPAGLKLGRVYDLQIGTSSGVASLARIDGIVDLETAVPSQSAAPVAGNDIAVAMISVVQPVPCLPFDRNRTLGSFILVDRLGGHTAAAGVVLGIEQSADDVPWQAGTVTPADRAALMGQSPMVYWLTGLSGSGKSTIASMFDQRLFALGRHVAVLDGDNLRHGLTSDLGFTDAGRIENMRRVTHVAALMADAGLEVIVSLISPFAAERARAREMIGAHRFMEVFVDAPLQVCAARDPKGHYQRAAEGKLGLFTGISSGYEPPDTPDLHLPTDRISPEEAVELLLDARTRKTLRSSA